MNDGACGPALTSAPAPLVDATWLLQLIVYKRADDHCEVGARGDVLWDGLYGEDLLLAVGLRDRRHADTTGAESVPLSAAQCDSVPLSAWTSASTY